MWHTFSLLRISLAMKCLTLTGVDAELSFSFSQDIHCGKLSPCKKLYRYKVNKKKTVKIAATSAIMTVGHCSQIWNKLFRMYCWGFVVHNYWTPLPLIHDSSKVHHSCSELSDTHAHVHFPYSMYIKEYSILYSLMYISQILNTMKHWDPANRQKIQKRHH